MPIWSEILREINESQDFDGVRRKYLLKLHEHTGRDVILYASGWLQKPDAPTALTTINDEDIHGLMEVTSGLTSGKLDLVLHSPGGSPESAEAIVSFLRSRFSDIRVIVPHEAMSAATMIACASDRIMLGDHSFLGPTDPQILMPTPLGINQVPAQAVLDQFDKALKLGQDLDSFPAWLPMLEQYGPHLIVQCESAIEMSRELVEMWLKQYMLKNEEKCNDTAKDISEWLANHQDFKSHSRHIARDELIERGLIVEKLEIDHDLADSALSAFHATIQTLVGTPSIKIMENHLGRAYIKQAPPPQVIPVPTLGPQLNQ